MLKALIIAGFWLQLAAPAFAAAQGAAPDVPVEATRRMARGRAAFKAATSPEELRDAAKEFQLASEAAPKWPDPVFNQAQALEKAGEPDGAKKAYLKYLELAPKAADAAAVRERIFELEYLAEKKRKEKDRVVIEGDWTFQGTTAEMKAELNGSELRVLNRDGDVALEAKLSGRRFEGWSTFGNDGVLHRADGSISEDNREIKWRLSVEKMSGSQRNDWDPDGDGWTDYALRTLTRRD